MRVGRYLYSSATSNMLCFLSHKKKFGIHFKTIILVFIIIFLENYMSEVA